MSSSSLFSPKRRKSSLEKQGIVIFQSDRNILYLREDELGDVTVVKCLSEEYSNSTAEINAIKKEFTIGKQFYSASPYIANYISKDWSDATRRWCFSMEGFEEHHSLLSVVTKHFASQDLFVPTTTILHIGLQLIEALLLIHKKKFVYNNLQPSNLFVRQDLSSIKLVHFRYTCEANLNFIPLIHFSKEELPYICPEQSGRMNKSIDYRSDFYSLGSLLYLLCTNMPPITQSSTSVSESFYNIMNEVPKAPHLINSQIPAFLSRIIMKLLSKNAEDRYQTHIGITTDLKRCIDNNYSSDDIPGQSDVHHTIQFGQHIVGREKEASHLLHLLETAKTASQPTIALLKGASGIGKSSIVVETTFAFVLV